MKRKIQGVTVTGDAIAAMIPVGQLPSTAKFLHAWFDYERNAFVCMFEDESFEEVPEGGRFPIDVDTP